MAKTKQKSRTTRWMEAASSASEALSDARQKLDEIFVPLVDALQQLAEIQEEYQEWLDNLPENLAQSALGEKLQAVCDLDLSNAGNDPSEIIENLEDVENTISEAEGIELPIGFGRD